MKTILQTMGGFLLGITILIASVFVLVFLINGGIRVAVWILPIINTVGMIAIGFNVIILLPIAAFKKTRGYAGIGFYISSYIFGIDVWLYSFLIAYSTWGAVGIIIGLALAGVGVVPIAALAALINSGWSVLFEIVIGVVLVFGTRYLGVHLMSKHDEMVSEQFNLQPESTDSSKGI